MKSKRSAEPRKRRPRRVATGPEAVLARHRAQCRICRHAQREEIEQEFLDWVPAREIAAEYKLGSHRAVYRHAHALSLFRARRGHIERVLDNIIERSGEAKITAGSVVSAIRLLVELNMPEMQFLLELLQASAGQRFAKRAPVRWDAGNAVEDDAGNRFRAAASPQPSPALKPAAKAAPPQVKLMIAPDPPREKRERKAAPMAYAAKEGEAKAKAEPVKQPPPAKPAAPAAPAPARAPAAPESGRRREPDGPPQVAGMAWPWAKGSSPFARRGRWRGRPVVG